jgi:O-antigen/teichoic acid export membrane protein
MLTRLSRLLPRGRFARGAAMLTGGTALGQMIVILSTPIITRLYSPQELGLASSFLAILLIVGVGSSLRYDYAILLPEDTSAAVHLLIVALLSSVLVSLTLLVVLLLFGESLSYFFNVPELIPYLWLLPIGTQAMGVYQSLNYWTVRQRDYRRIAQTRITQNLGQVGLQVILGLLGTGAVGMISGYIVGQASGVGTLLRPLYVNRFREMRSVQSVEVRHTAWHYREFPLFSTPATVLNSIGLRVTPLVFAALFGLQVAGLYSFADRLTSVPVALIASSIGQVFLAEVSRRIHTEPTAVSHLFYRMSARLLLLGIAVGVPLIVIAPSLLGIIFGSEWSAAGVYLQWWGFVVIIQMVVSPLSILPVLGRVRWQLAWDLLRVILTIGGLVLAREFNRTPEEAMAIYGIAMVITYGILFLMNVWALRHLNDRKTVV